MTLNDPINQIVITATDNGLVVRCTTVTGHRTCESYPRGSDLVTLVTSAYYGSARTLRKEVVTALCDLSTALRGSLHLTYERATEPNVLLET